MQDLQLCMVDIGARGLDAYRSIARLDVPETQAELEAAERIAAARAAGARAVAAARKARLAEEIAAAEARWRESQASLRRLKEGARPEDIAAAVARLESARALYALYQMELEQSRKLATQGIDSQHLLEVRRTQVLTQEKAVEQARLDWERLKAGPTAAELEAAGQAMSAREAERDLARAGRHDVEALEAERAVREAEHAEAAARLREAGARHAGGAPAEANGRRLENRDLVSPVDGVVLRRFKRVGEVCARGAPCLLVADANQPRWIEGYVREADALRVRVGQKAWVRAPADVAPPVEAVVEQVRLHTEAFAGIGVPGAAPALPAAARVWVRLRPLTPLPDDLPAGLSAEAAILVRSVPNTDS